MSNDNFVNKTKKTLGSCRLMAKRLQNISRVLGLRLICAQLVIGRLVMDLLLALNREIKLIMLKQLGGLIVIGLLLGAVLGLAALGLAVIAWKLWRILFLTWALGG